MTLDSSAVLVVTEFATSYLLVQNSTLTATTHTGGRIVLQVTLTPGVTWRHPRSRHSQTVEGQITLITKHVQSRTASYLVPEKEHDVCPPTSTQLLSTNMAYDGNPLAMMSVNCGE